MQIYISYVAQRELLGRLEAPEAPDTPAEDPSQQETPLERVVRLAAEAAKQAALAAKGPQEEPAALPAPLG